MQDIQRIRLESANDLYHILNVINDTNVQLIDEQVTSNKVSATVTRLIQEEMENYIKDIAVTASLNMMVQEEDCSKVVDFDCEPFDEQLQKQVDQKEKEARKYIMEIVEIRKKIPRDMQLLLQEMTAKQAAEADMDVKMVSDIPGLQREIESAPPVPDVSVLTEDYNDVMDILARLEKNIPSCISQYEEFQNLLQSVQSSSSSCSSSSSSSSSSS